MNIEKQVSKKEYFMKKAFLIGSAIFMVLLMTACDDLLIPPAAEEAANILYTTDGRRLVNLNIGRDTDSGRALHENLAEAGTDYYEVVFVNAAEDEFYRTSWKEGQTARLAVPPGTYDNGTGNGKAYMFAGRYSDKALLAIGVLAKVDGNDDVYVIDAATTRVDFKLAALTTNVDGSGTGTFQVTGTSGGVTVSSIKVEEKDIPVYILSQADGAVVNEFTAEYNIELDVTQLPNSGTNLNDDILEKIMVQGAPSTPTATHKAYIWDGGDGVNPSNISSVQFTSSTPDMSIVLPIEMELSVPGKDDADPGLCKLYFEVPVYMLSKDRTSGGGDTAAAVTWVIKGGLNNHLPDLGYDAKSLGGAVLLGIGSDVLEGAINGILISGEQ